MLNIPVKLSGLSSTVSAPIHFKFSFPVKVGSVYSTEFLETRDELGKVITTSFNILSRWPDSSIKWVEAYCMIAANTNVFSSLTITENTKLQNSDQDDLLQSFYVVEGKDEVIIYNNNSEFKINLEQLGLFGLSNDSPYSTQKQSIEFIDINDQVYIPQIQSPVAIHANSLQVSVTLIGIWLEKESLTAIKDFHFKSTFTFFKDTSQVDFKLTIHNAKSTHSKDGKWDLGDNNALLFKQLNLIFPQLKSSTTELTITDDSIAHNLNELYLKNHKSIELYQASSGGKNWHSQNHVNSKNEQPLLFRGFKLNQAQQNIAKGHRAEPIVNIKVGCKRSQIIAKEFWQRFPKSISFDGDTLNIGVFPKAHKDTFELQPGEKSTYKISFNVLSQSTSVKVVSKVLAHICPNYVSQTKAIPLFSNPTNDNDFRSIIDQGLHGNNNFFEKREEIDEYGWRNFGDIFADHEKQEYQGKDELISHYNNQYDPLLGFLQQHLISAEKKWLLLAEDLAQHIKDIDIYDTKNDRNEYNQGLFWHTDHYVPAKTATHRTYSRHQPRGVYIDHVGAGGPGSNHCYTSGLALHYFLTGSKSSKKAVLNLANWITHVFEGSGTIGETLLSIKNINRPDTKNIITQTYPFDRGTGNYINTLIDAFEVSTQQSYLDKASLVLKNTFSNSDDINERKLNNVEDTWFYVIVLQAAYKYLLVKEQNNQLDSSFYYVRAAFLHYADWVCKHECPYLDNAEILEYPNITWAAQDIRKANILFMAGYFCTEQKTRDLYNNRANEFNNYVSSALKGDPLSQQTRVLSVIMQNRLIKSFAQHHQHKNFYNEQLRKIQVRNKSDNPLMPFMFNIIKNTNIKKELNWLRKVSPQINDLLLNIGFKQ